LTRSALFLVPTAIVDGRTAKALAMRASSR